MNTFAGTHTAIAGALLAAVAVTGGNAAIRAQAPGRGAPAPPKSIQAEIARRGSD